MSSSQAAIPYIGSKISLVTNSELRYEGILVNINTANSTVTLKDVRMSGTENRKTSHFVMPSAEVFDYIIFNGRDIKDLTVSEPSFSVKEDPAVVAVNVPPSQQGPHIGGPGPMGFYRDHPGLPYGDHPMHREPGPMHPGGFGAPRYGGPRGGMPFMGGPRGPRSDMYGPHGPGPMRGGFSGRGGMRGGAGPGGSRQVVGELAAQPNSNLKTQVEQAFNFEEANQKFEKGAKTSVAEEHPERENIKSAYNRGASFFDSISCEALNRQQGRESRVDREKQRELDTETFGPAATLVRGTRYYRRGYRRPMGGRGGRMLGGHPGQFPTGAPMVMPGSYGQRMAPMGYGYGMGPVRAK